MAVPKVPLEVAGRRELSDFEQRPDVPGGTLDFDDDRTAHPCTARRPSARGDRRPRICPRRVAPAVQPEGFTLASDAWRSVSGAHSHYCRYFAFHPPSHAGECAVRHELHASVRPVCAFRQLAGDRWSTEGQHHTAPTVGNGPFLRRARDKRREQHLLLTRHHT